MAIDDAQANAVFDAATEAMRTFAPVERIQFGFLAGILSEIRTTRELQQAQLDELKAIREATERLCGALSRDDGSFYVVTA